MHPVIDKFGRARALSAARAELAALRAQRHTSIAVPAPEALATACQKRIETAERSTLKRVFNLTGTVIHTNLGRSVMPQCAIDAVSRVMADPVTLEFDLGEGARGERDSHVEGLLTRLTGAEAAVVVNNNAAAVYLVLNTLAQGKEVPVSRGELVEIGGSFRIPEIMRRAGAHLVEVGTTNRTHMKDYQAALGDQTAALMKVHTSNYRIEGFTAAVSEQELAGLAHTQGLPMVTDLGSGTLVDLRAYGLPHEPTPNETLGHGVDLVTFSGDKLLGGPQAGLIVGRRDLIQRLRANPMKRALRLDKVMLAALESVLRLYEAPDRLTQELPVLRFLTRSVQDIRTQATRLLPSLRANVPGDYDVSVVDTRSQIGSGSLPVDLLPSVAIQIRKLRGRATSEAGAISAAFRALPIPAIGRVNDGAFLLDLRCLEDEDEFCAQLASLRFEGAS
jgi:L-seryl-tRNA(Ser) seleniumtransferase